MNPSFQTRPRSVFPIWLVLLLVPLAGCELSGSPDEVAPSDLIVANGGNFSDQNGFLSTIDLEGGAVSHGEDLGGFAHGLFVEGDRVHVLLNTFSEGRVEVLTNTATGLVRTAQWTGLVAPRDMAFAADTAWVSNFVFGAAGTVTPVHRTSGVAGPPIEVGEAPEGVLLMDDWLFVANNGQLGAGSTLSAIHTVSRNVVTVPVPCDGPRDLARRTSTELVVVCTGKTVYSADFSTVLEETSGRIVFMEVTGSGSGSGAGVAAQVVRSLDLDVQAGNANGSRAIHVSEQTSELFVSLADGSIQVVDLAARTSGARIVPADDAAVAGIAGVAYNADLDVLYVGRLARSGAGPFPDYTVSGEVHAIGRDGSIRDRWTVGPAPSALVLR